MNIKRAKEEIKDIKERFSEEDFPAWAMRVVLDEETFNERRQ